MHAMVHWWADADCCLYVGNVAALSQCYCSKTDKKRSWFSFKTKLASFTLLISYPNIQQHQNTQLWAACPAVTLQGQCVTGIQLGLSLPQWYGSQGAPRMSRPPAAGMEATVSSGWAFCSLQELPVISLFPSWGSWGLNHHPLPLDVGLRKSCM